MSQNGATKTVVRLFPLFMLAMAVIAASLLIRCYVVVSGSMEPYMPTGSVAVTTPFGLDALGVGDVITFRNGDIDVTHRIVEITGSGADTEYITKGDANDAPDAKAVSAASVEGKLLFSIPNAGYVLHFLRTPMGIAAIVCFLAGAFVLSRVFPKRERDASHAL